MPRHLPIYLRTLRKRSALSLKELALLLNISAAGLSLIERQGRRPSVAVMIGTKIIFGQDAHIVFPAIYGEIEDRIMRQAKALYERLEGRGDIDAAEKLRVLLDMIRRVEVRDTDI